MKGHLKMINNDEKILLLKTKIEEKKKAIAKAERFSPTTNCIINGSNINVLDINSLFDLLVELTMKRTCANNLDMGLTLKYSGFSIDDWIEDITSKIMCLQVSNEKSKLKTMENKLDSMLSSDKKIELELLELENLLK